MVELLLMKIFSKELVPFHLRPKLRMLEEIEVVECMRIAG